jgi:PHD/YefM family antitoxin component YafN of YafNO toxin-antitoxin module
MKLHPKILESDGKPVFVVLPHDEYVALKEALEDALDSLALREARERSKGQRRYTTDEVKAMFGIKDAPQS